VDGERSTERHELAQFARDVAQRIDKDRIHRKFDKVVLVAAPRMLGLLRRSLSTPTAALLVGEVPKDLVQQGPEAVLSALPQHAFSELQ
jgi:protein required for attachment to host cells